MNLRPKLQAIRSTSPSAGLLLALAVLSALFLACAPLAQEPGDSASPVPLLPSPPQEGNGQGRADAVTTAPVSPTTSPAPTASAEPSRASPSPTAAPATAVPSSTAAAPSPGAIGIGDPYFPTMGNGGYDALHYDLTLRVYPPIQEIEGLSVMRARATQDLSAFYLDFEQLTIEELLVDGLPAAYEHDGDQFLVTPAQPLLAGTEFRVQVGYRGRPLPSSDPGVPAGWYWTAGLGTVAGEPFGAQTWFPANDHPLDKATYRLQVTVPRPLVVASNGLLVETIEDDETITYVWQARDPMPSYLVTVSIDDYKVHETVTPGGLPLVSFAPPGQAASIEAAMQSTVDMIDYFEELFGPYPFETYGVVAVQGRLPGFAALETQTRSLFFGVPLREDILAHELAHQWFGNSVSLQTWKDLWLKEGMATYAELLWLERSRGRGAVDAAVASLHEQMSQGARAGFYPPPGRPALDSLYGFPVYQGGAVVLHALRLTVGDAAFFRALRLYTGRYAYGNAGTADLLSVFEEASGQELSDFFEAWVYGSPPPALPEGQPPEEWALLRTPGHRLEPA
jgi:aminopeptidase N